MRGARRRLCLAPVLLSLALGCAEAGKDGAAGGSGTDGSAGSSGADGEDGTPASEIDEDGDGVSVVDDCDDADPAVGEAVTLYLDYDGDGFGDPGVAQVTCFSPTGWVADTSDCDDLDPAVNPDGTEVCNDGIDDDCDGLADDADDSLDESTTVQTFPDLDGDGWGDDVAPISACAVTSETTLLGGDCNDLDDSIHPDATEICGDGIDQNCNGSADQCVFDEELTDADADVTLEGSGSFDYFADSLATADVNGDGLDDLLIGVPNDDDPVTSAGAAYVLHGSTTADTAWDTADAGRVLGSSSASYAGYSVAGVGDTNADGFDDVIVGCTGEDEAWLVYGSASALTDTHAGGDRGATFVTENDIYYFGRALGPAGDVDGDGYADLLISDEGATSYRGAVYLVLGSASALSGEHYVEDVAAVEFRAAEVGGDFGERGSTGYGDFDGDGLSDVVLGHPSRDADGTSYGGVFVFSGASGFSAEVTTDDADVALSAASEPDSQLLGGCADGIGDWDGDGLDDLATCSRFADNGGATSAGAVRVHTGGASWPGALSTTSAALVVRGEQAGEDLGTSLAKVGDIDGDGQADLLVSASGFADGGSNAGGAFLFYGDTAAGSTRTTTDADVTVGVSAANAYGGRAITAGDYNGDGSPDLVLGAYGWRTFRGAAFAFFGEGY